MLFTLTLLIWLNSIIAGGAPWWIWTIWGIGAGVTIINTIIKVIEKSK